MRPRLSRAGAPSTGGRRPPRSPSCLRVSALRAPQHRPGPQGTRRGRFLLLACLPLPGQTLWSSGPQPLWPQGPASCERLPPEGPRRGGGCRYPRGFTLPPLTSCCAAPVLTGPGEYPAWPRAWGPCSRGGALVAVCGRCTRHALCKRRVTPPVVAAGLAWRGRRALYRRWLGPGRYGGDQGRRGGRSWEEPGP